MTSTKLFFAIVFALTVSTAAQAQITWKGVLTEALRAGVDVNHDYMYLQQQRMWVQRDVATAMIYAKRDIIITAIQETEQTKRQIHNNNTDLARTIVQNGGCPGCEFNTSYNSGAAGGPSSSFRASNVLAQADDAMCKRAKARGQTCEVPR